MHAYTFSANHVTFDAHVRQIEPPRAVSSQITKLHLSHDMLAHVLATRKVRDSHV